MVDQSYERRLQHLEESLGVHFQDKSFLTTALTHRSYVHQYRDKGIVLDNERLEFFGDAILKFLISEWLFERHKSYSEGQLTKLRSKLISDKNLAVLGDLLQIGMALRVSTGEQREDGRYNPSMLANAFEAIIGALYLDSGMDVVRLFIHRLYQTYYEQLTVDERLFDYKSDLQEFLQKEREELPSYTVVSTEGPEHQKRFFVDVMFSVGGKKYVFSGNDMTKKDAEEQAAKSAVVFLESHFN